MSKPSNSLVKFTSWYYHRLNMQKRQPNRCLPRQLDALTDGFMIRQDINDSQTENRLNMVDKNSTFGGANHIIPVNRSQVDMQTLERSVTGRMLTEVDNAIATVHARVHDASLAWMESLVIPMKELAIKSMNSSCFIWPRPECFPSEYIRPWYASSQLDSNTDLKRIDETYGNITVEANYLSLSEKNFDRQTFTHHSLITNSVVDKH